MLGIVVTGVNVCIIGVLSMALKAIMDDYEQQEEERRERQLYFMYNSI